jgi:hypothetical protein
MHQEVHAFKWFCALIANLQSCMHGLAALQSVRTRLAYIRDATSKAYQKLAYQLSLATRVFEAALRHACLA